MNAESELAALKQEVARLRREMDEYRQFIHYQPPGEGDDGKPEAGYLTIRCAFFMLVHPSNPNRSQVNIMGGRDGAFVSVMGSDEKTRLVMNVEKNVPEFNMMDKDGQYKASLRLDKGEPALELYGKDGKIGVQLKVLGAEGRGQIGVCEAGKARAVMKATEKGAAISAVHDDGHARITLVSSQNNGEMFAVTPDMKIGVKIAADAIDGGLITVNRANGKAGVIISNTPIGGTVVVQDHSGKITGHLPTGQEE